MLQVCPIEMWLKKWKWIKKQSRLGSALAPQQSQKLSAPVLEHQTQRSNANVIECISRDRAHASSASEVHVALAAIANLLRRVIPERLRVINRIPGDRAQTMRSSAHDLAAILIFAYK